MKNLFILTIIVFSFNFAFSSDGKIQFDQETLDIGNVDVGNEAKAEFKFTNTGDGILKILNVKPG